MTHHRRRGHPAPLAAALSALLLQACQQAPLVPAPLNLPRSAEIGAQRQDLEASGLRATALPAPPAASAPARAPERAPSPEQTASVPALLNLDQVSLGTFINVAYAEVLKKSVSIDPAVLARRDLVTFRSGEGQSSHALESAVQLLLKSYGVSAVDVGGLVRVVPDNASLGAMPEIRRGAALPDTPLPLRPVFHLIELQAVRQIDVIGWLRTLFGDRVKIQEDSSRNAILVSGTPDNVKAALEAINVLDQPLMSARASLSLTPAYWSSEELAKRLADVLAAQGYAVNPVGQPLVAGGVRYPIILLPVPALNSVFVFAANETLLKHVRTWAETLDKPNERSIGKSFLTYQVKHKDAELLAKTLQQVLTGSRATATVGGAQAGGQAAAPGAAGRTSVVVDKSTNTLIYQAGPDEFGQITALLQALDRPSKAALIEVTVAEVSLDDQNQFGIEWLLNGGGPGNQTFTAGTLGGISLGSSGFTYSVLNNAGQVRARLNALSSTNRVSILSSPRVMARNGEEATVQVGQEVPIITSQQTTGTTVNTGTTATPGVLQTVQYRSTGVILKVKPAIHSGDQIDLDLVQEVSEAATTDTGVNVSPTFSTRKVDTKLTLQNGSTVMLAGLISNTSTRGGGGIPLLKDIPVIGSLFGKQTVNGQRRELIVLITPYILSDSRDAEAVTDAFRGLLGPWARPPQADDTGAGKAVKQ
jgi:general secretion pathway protein D